MSSESVNEAAEDQCEPLRRRRFAASLLLQFFDLLRRFRLRKIVADFFVRLLAKCMDIGALRTRHRLVTCGPIIRIFLRVRSRFFLSLAVNHSSLVRKTSLDIQARAIPGVS